MFGAGVGRALAGATIAVIVAAAALAFITIDAPPLKARAKSPRHAPPAASTPEVVLQEAAAPPPPPTSSEFTPAKLPSSAPAPQAERPAAPPDLSALPIDELRDRANHDDATAMEELGRRLIQGTNITKDPQAGAGWLLRAAQRGSAQSAFNVGVMYERGFVVERDSIKAAEWYRKAADAGLPVAKHNLALLLRDGKGVARDGKAAVALLKSAARQGMAASMFTLGDIYDRGDAAPRDAVEALAWFAVAAEFDRQLNNGGETTLSKTADQRAQALQRTLTPEELARAQDRAQGEFRLIVETLTPPQSTTQPPPAASEPAPSAQAEAPPAAPAAPEATASPPSESSPLAWPAGKAEQVKAIQQMLFDLKLLHDKPDGTLGPLTRTAIRDFQKTTTLPQTGEPSKELYDALRLASSGRDVVANSPLPSPAKVETPTAGRQAAIELPPVEAPPAPPSSADIARALPATALPKAMIDPPKPPMPRIEPEKPAPVKVDLTPPPPPPAPADPDAWPANRIDQVKAIQAMLHDLKIYNSAIDGVASGGTRTAIRDYQRLAGLKETGEPSKALFDSLKEMRALMSSKPLLDDKH